MRVTGGIGRAHSAGKSSVDHDEWLQVGLEVVIYLDLVYDVSSHDVMCSLREDKPRSSRQT